MQVYLLRHGIAEEAPAGKSDADRALTPEGRRKLKQVLEAAAEAEVKPSLILTSPLKRAIQTAQIAATVLRYSGDIVDTTALRPGSTPEQAWDEIRLHRGEAALMLVGHNPLFDTLGGYLLGQPELQIQFKKGAILRVDMESFGAKPKGVLRWYLTPKLTKS